jgi:hypothetical protein
MSATDLILFVSTEGNDQWSGRLAEPNADRTDGPFASIGAARDAVRARKLAGRLATSTTVQLRGGRYVLAEPVQFGPEDSGPITYSAYPGEQPILDGGRRVEGWQIETHNGMMRWVADVPEVRAGNWYFRQLWVNGERRPRARLPKTDWFWMEDVPGKAVTAALFDGTDTFRAAPGDIQNWNNLEDVEVVAFHFWIDERMPIAAYDPETRLVRSSRRSMFALRDDVAQRFARYYVENVGEALSEPGEWYLDRAAGKVYYIPHPGETPDAVDVYASNIEQLLRLVGKPGENRWVEFLRFEGLHFEHAQWRQPGGGGERFDLMPGIDFASAPQAAFNIPGVIYLEGARFCALENCRVAHVGGYAVELSQGCQGNRLVGNEFFDLGAGGVKLDGADVEAPLAMRTGNNRVADNHIHSGGRVFHSAIGVLAVHSFGNTIAHNHIHDFFYTGISCGWVWGYTDNVSRDNRIEHNHIHDIGHGLLSDMGGIYTLGVQPGTVLRGNLIHDIEKRNYGGWAIYLDEGSSHILVENNICFNTSSTGFNQHYGRENIVRNNIFAFGKEGQVSLGRKEDHNSFTFQRNIVITDGQVAYVGRWAPSTIHPTPGNRPARLEASAFSSDLNVFWDVRGEPPLSANGGYDAQANWLTRSTFTMEEVQALGYDRHSVVADPLCADLRGFDFTLAEDSPAFTLGFKAIDMSEVGPRPVGRREE